jgi:dihydrodipicolinate synthase/N-acetylneuraminate lyase
MLEAKDLRGVYAIIPTPAKSNANQWDAVDTVDLDETARVVDRLIADGVDGLIALGTTGECATLINRDYDAFVDCFLSTAARRVPTFVGASALGTHEVVRRIRFIAERGGDGTLLGLPMWQPLTQEMAVRYYETISKAFPNVAVMVYANPRAFRFDFNAEFWGAVSRRAATVMSAKFSYPKRLLDVLATSGGKINFLPHENDVHEYLRLSPETTIGCWSTAASMGPSPTLAIMDAIIAGDRAAAEKINADLNWANEPVMSLVRVPEEFASYNIQVEKIRINEAGYCKAGPIRPPYDVVPDAYAEASRLCGQRWAELVKKYPLNSRRPAAAASPQDARRGSAAVRHGTGS